MRETVIEGETGVFYDAARARGAGGGRARLRSARRRPGALRRQRRALRHRPLPPRVCARVVDRGARGRARAARRGRAARPPASPVSQRSRREPRRRRRPDLERRALAARAACIAGGPDAGADRGPRRRQRLARRLAGLARAEAPGRARARARGEHGASRRRPTAACAPRRTEASRSSTPTSCSPPDWLERMAGGAGRDPGVRAVACKMVAPRRPGRARRLRRRPAPRRRLRAARARATRRRALGRAGRGLRGLRGRGAVPARGGARRGRLRRALLPPTSRTSTSACACSWPAGAARYEPRASRATRAAGPRTRSSTPVADWIARNTLLLDQQALAGALAVRTSPTASWRGWSTPHGAAAGRVPARAAGGAAARCPRCLRERSALADEARGDRGRGAAAPVARPARRRPPAVRVLMRSRCWAGSGDALLCGFTMLRQIEPHDEGLMLAWAGRIADGQLPTGTSGATTRRASRCCWQGW